MKKRIFALAAACMMIAAGCSAPPAPSATVSDSPSTAAPQPESTPQPTPEPEPPQEVDRDLTYSVTVSDYSSDRLKFDADGNLLPPYESSDMVVLRDIVTGEPRYRTHTLVEDTGEDDQYGSPIVRRTTALWDIDGNLLCDYGDYTYMSPLGDLLIRQKQRDGFWVDASMIPKDFFTELWNYKTGESVQGNVAQLTPIGDSGSLFLATTIYGHMLGTVDSDGRVVNGFDEAAKDYYHAWVCGEMIVARNQPYDYLYSAEQDGEPKSYPGPAKEILLTPELVPILGCDSFSSFNRPGSKVSLRYTDGDSMGLMDLQGNKLFSLPSLKYSYIDFCDDELLITVLNTSRSLLMDLQGNAITKEYDQIEPMGVNRWSPEKNADRFAAQLGTTVDILDRQGQVTASRDIQNLSSVQAVNNDYISYSVEPSNSYGLLDMELNTVLESGRYDSLYSPSMESADGSYTRSPLIIGSYYPGKRKDGQVDYSMRRYDILDSKLVPIITNLTVYGTVGQGRIAVVRGFSAGVIDWQGNWIGKTTIFQTVSDELGREIY